MGWPMSILCMLLLWFAEKNACKKHSHCKGRRLSCPFFDESQGVITSFHCRLFSNALHFLSTFFFNWSRFFRQTARLASFEAESPLTAPFFSESRFWRRGVLLQAATHEKNQKHKVRRIFSILVTHNVLGEIQLVITKTDSAFLVLDTKQCCRWPFLSVDPYFPMYWITYLFRIMRT